MHYRDLVRFESIETVIQLREADAKDEARRLVETYVISERMADQLVRLIIPQLQIDKPKDNKGLLIVGNYGTGKSHLMSVISAIAEHADLVEKLRQPESGDVRKAAQQIAGKFKVIRTEIGGVTRPLRDIVFDELTAGLAEMGIKHTFPSMSEVSNNKDLLVAMMGAFQEKYPDQGLMLVVDELLEFLRTRDQMAIVLDLSFLREVGEVCRLTRFRFVAGLQESLFDSPRFQFVADSIRRVKDRFEQVRIAREDVAYVVAERLLRKSDKQKAQIREHLEKFTPLYGTMAEKLDEFVRLFPVHPAYLNVFERVYVVEKRQALKTISLAMAALLDRPVPDSEPGLIAYDAYWQFMIDDPSLRSIPDVKEVMDKSKVLEDRVTHAFTRPQLKPMALRIIRALSVHRLTTDSLDAALGATADELRDDLCLYAPMPEMDADFLKTTVESTLSAILTTVSGQFISFNPENGQYYLDLKKDIDFDAQIAAKAEVLSDDQLNQYYFQALASLLETGDTRYVTNFNIWQHEVEWRGHGINRPGYLFLGTPNERSTAQPPREFYLFMLQPFKMPEFKDEQRADEVFFRLAKRDADFESRLRLYGGAKEMSGFASSSTRGTYVKKAEDHLKRLLAWLRDNLNQCFEVTHAGVTKTVLEWIKGASGARSNLSPRELVNAVAANRLKTKFDDDLKDYPEFAFGDPVTQANIGAMATEAIQWLTGSVKTKPGAIVLDGLELKDGDRVRARESRYGKYFLSLLHKKGEGQVVNRPEIMEDAHGVERDARFRLEPEWVAVVLLALAYQGEIALAIPGKKIDAGNLEDAMRAGIADLREFRHIERPKGLPVGALQTLFELLGLATGLVTSNDQDKMVTDLQARVSEHLNRTVTTLRQAQTGLPCWNTAVLEGATKADAVKRIEGYKTFLESLQTYNTPGRLKNFKYSTDEVQARRADKALAAEIEELGRVVDALQPLTGYLGVALAVLPGDDALAEKIRKTQESQLARLRDPRQRRQSQLRATLIGELETLKREYIKTYLDLHKKARLNMAEDARKGKLGSDPRFERLKMLARIEFMPTAQLREFQTAYASLRTCQAIGESDLATSPICPNCKYRPIEELMTVSAQTQLARLEEELERLHGDWQKALLDNLDDPSARANLDLLKKPQRTMLEKFLKDVEFPNRITADFVEAVNDALKGLTRVSVTPEQVVRALTEGGMPCDMKELRARFDSFVESLTLGKDAGKVRIVIEASED
ncbi:MAG TPA: DUF6079 family protein [Anaerolineae bacterium]|nr:DUF6079 family protein [Anaerolineae bacterium]